VINDHNGGRKPSFLGLWIGRAIGWLCFGDAGRLLFQHLTSH
jgi:hypothetical protein